ncbi:hypothetical protein [Polaromonas sp.]|uniref:hypothetical protein n=1 Tax=Polaromonas sp. TaxID=1869339 RepID=UPI0013BA01D2|nr:hypothetical protein [Polaromonas sp.]NDP64159.1 hypothetical protein [Polaromonas sp.]
MKAEIDLLKFEQSSGHLKYLQLVGAEFLRQLPQWRTDFAAALAQNNLSHQLDLLHKIKGSCYAVAAYNTIEVITQSEAAHALDKPQGYSRLLHRLEWVEAELHAIVANAPAKK